tara:strand:+ start:3252 stop:3992 length:741 start_codon:yes stop_codon:yes gene_type:complete
MSVLSDEQKQAFMAKLEGNEPPEAEAPEETVDAASEPEVQEDPEEEYSDEDPEAEAEDVHHVPYSRFKNVIATRNELRDRVKELEENLLYARDSQVTQEEAPRAKPESVWDEFDALDEPQGEAPDGRLELLEGRLNQVDSYVAERELELELVQVQHEYPEVPQEIILEAIIGDPELQAMDVAAGYSEFIAEIEEGALARYKSENQGVAKRVGSMSASVAGAETSGGGPKTLGESREALLSFLTQGN